MGPTEGLPRTSLAHWRAGIPQSKQASRSWELSSLRRSTRGGKGPAMGPGSRLPLTNCCVVLESFSYSRPLPFNPAPPPWGHTASRTPSSARQDVLSHPIPDSPSYCLSTCLPACLPALFSSRLLSCRPNSPGLVLVWSCPDWRRLTNLSLFPAKSRPFFGSHVDSE